VINFSGVRNRAFSFGEEFGMSSVNRNRRIFLLHSNRDVSIARQVTQTLQEAGFDVWTVNDQLTIGGSVIELIDSGLKETDAVVAIWSSSSLTSKWFAYELGLASERGLDILVVMVDDLHSSGPFPVPCKAFIPYEKIAQFFKDHYPGTDVRDKGSAHASEQDTIPPTPPNFVRTDALLELEARARRHPLVAVVGAGGIGKTVLAAAFAHWAREVELVDRAVWLDGNQLSLEPLVAQLYRSLKLTEAYESIRDAIVRITPALASERTLVVLDDASQGSLDFMLGLYAAAAGTRLVVTTRDPALVSGVAEIAVLGLDPLSLRDGASFLRQLVLPGVELSDERAREITSEAGGHPLALRLIAGQLNSGVDADPILRELRLNMPHSEPSGSLMEALERCYATLSPPERDLLKSLALFEGSPVTIRTLSTALGDIDLPAVQRDAAHLKQLGILQVVNGRLTLHAVVIEYLKEKDRNADVAPSATLYITVDPSLMAKEDIGELLDALNMLYSRLGGDELLIREDEIGHFTRAGVLV
jgi:hypothetical protein